MCDRKQKTKPTISTCCGVANFSEQMWKMCEEPLISLMLHLMTALYYKPQIQSFF